MLITVDPARLNFRARASALSREEAIMKCCRHSGWEMKTAG